MSVSWRDLLAEATERVGAADARRIVTEVTGLMPGEWATGLDAPATERSVARFDQLLARRERGEPLQYVLGGWGFRTLDLMVDARVLIPRPETEVVAGLAIEAARRRRAPTVVDLGTGSGAIALSVAAELYADDGDIEVWATDVSSDALDVARANLAGIGRAATRVRCAAGSWYEALDGSLAGSVDVIVSNPPYVPERDREELPGEVVDWEPVEALISGDSGLEALEHVVASAPGWLADDGVLVVEVDPRQAAAVAAMARDAGFSQAMIHPDLTHRMRAVVAQRD